MARLPPERQRRDLRGPFTRCLTGFGITLLDSIHRARTRPIDGSLLRCTLHKGASEIGPLSIRNYRMPFNRYTIFVPIFVVIASAAIFAVHFNWVSYGQQGLSFSIMHAYADDGDGGDSGGGGGDDGGDGGDSGGGGGDDGGDGGDSGGGGGDDTGGD